jgi:dihydroxyacetone kinase
MTYLHNAPENFRGDMITGFVRAHAGSVRAVPGGVVRAQAPSVPKVSVVIGGGSGHYPAFAGLVGEGLADGAVMGDVFASPSAAQIVNVVRATPHDQGVLLCYGNYTGDVLNFSLAEQRLRHEGIACESVRVTDDVTSADASEKHRRRGVAGDLVVSKIAGAAAERGDDLSTVAALAERANSRTFTMGIGFSGCTLPGAAAPLFSISPGRMAVGMGIHGEPGLGEADLVSAHSLAQLMVDRLAQEGHPLEGSRLAAVVNGLGSVSQEELFVLFGGIARLLDDAGALLVAPQVGEFVTSFEMAGASLTLTWLDDDLEPLWRAGVATPAFTRAVDRWDSHAATNIPEAADDERSRSSASAEPTSLGATGRVAIVLGAVQEAIDRNAEDLGRLDAVAGDGDHGIGMQRGIAAAVAATANVASTRRALRLAADAWADRAGGTSGALWGLILGALADAMPEGDDPPTLQDVAAGWSAAAAAVARAGGAQRGEKTLLDALIPFTEQLSSEPNRPLDEAWSAAVDAAHRGAEQTSQLIARRGRARTHGAAGLGSPDPGAVSFVLVVAAVAPHLVPGGSSPLVEKVAR